MAQTGEIRCAMDHILEAERKGEINHDNVLYIVENINVAGNNYIQQLFLFPVSHANSESLLNSFYSCHNSVFGNRICSVSQNEAGDALPLKERISFFHNVSHGY